jgi:hypothetical protein
MTTKEEKELLRAHYSKIGTKGGTALWANMSKEERSKEMKRRRKKGHKKLLETLKRIREEDCPEEQFNN